jgi:hypothetical protein
MSALKRSSLAASTMVAGDAKRCRPARTTPLIGADRDLVPDTATSPSAWARLSKRCHETKTVTVCQPSLGDPCWPDHSVGIGHTEIAENEDRLSCHGRFLGKDRENNELDIDFRDSYKLENGLLKYRKTVFYVAAV